MHACSHAHTHSTLITRTGIQLNTHTHTFLGILNKCFCAKFLCGAYCVCVCVLVPWLDQQSTKVFSTEFLYSTSLLIFSHSKLPHNTLVDVYNITIPLWQTAPPPQKHGPRPHYSTHYIAPYKHTWSTVPPPPLIHQLQMTVPDKPSEWHHCWARLFPQLPVACGAVAGQR